jgi:hypothetical protein
MRWALPWCSAGRSGASTTAARSGRSRSTNHPIQDIDADFARLKKSTIRLDSEESERHLRLAEDVFAGLLPVEAGRAGSAYSNGITNQAVHLTGAMTDRVARTCAMIREMTGHPEGRRG